MAERRKFYVTGGLRTDGRYHDDTYLPIVCEGTDRLDALSRSGLTVWEESEFREMVSKLPEYRFGLDAEANQPQPNPFDVSETGPDDAFGWDLEPRRIK